MSESDSISPNPLRILNDAVKRVPALKYALCVAGIAAAAAIVKAFLSDPRVAVFSIIVMLILMTVLVIFAKLTAIASTDFRLPARILIWFSLLLVILVSSLLFTSTFFNWSLKLRDTLVIQQKHPPQVLQPSGPIVQVPAALIFRGESPAPSATNDADGRGPIGAAPMMTTITPEQVAAARQAIVAWPNDPKMLSDAGSILAAVGDVQEGVELLAKARGSFPDDPVVAYNYARAFYQQGEVDWAVEQADAAIALRANFDEPWLLKAGIVTEKEDYNKAEQFLQKVLNKVSVVRIIQGVIEMKRGNIDRAIRLPRVDHG
jgi:tetratricopeptide (TPR) repeat protein